MVVTEERLNEVVDFRKGALFELNKKLVRLAWDFCRFDLDNLMDFMGHPLNPADEELIIEKELDVLVKTLQMPTFREVLLKQADRTYTARFREWVENRNR